MEDKLKIYGLQGMYDIQSSLSHAQATPIVGPILVSPVKFNLSIVQVALGASSAILAWPASKLLKSRKFSDIAIAGALHSSMGTIAGIYSLSNMASLGIVGAVVIHGQKKRKEEQEKFIRM